jgi:hypothetical protein
MSGRCPLKADQVSSPAGEEASGQRYFINVIRIQPFRRRAHFVRLMM